MAIRLNFVLVWFLYLLMGAQVQAGAPQPERVIWDKTPIPITLTVGRERMIHFPTDVSPGLPASIDALVRVQSVNGVLYLQAMQPFEKNRVMVREVDSGRTYLFDLKAVEKGGPTQAIEVYSDQQNDVPELLPDGSRNPLYSARETPSTPGYPALTRFAALQMYAPRRLLEELPGVMRAPIKPRPISLVRGGEVRAEPLIGWQAGNLYVTAVKLVNTTHHAVILDPRRLRGQWLAATFQHGRLFPRGDEADTTCVYLVSRIPFDEAI